MPELATVLVPMIGAAVDVRARGNGEGISSTASECGLRNGPEVIGRLLTRPIPFGSADAVLPSGVGGGEVPSLLRSFLVICDLVCESSAASKVNKDEDGQY